MSLILEYPATGAVTHTVTLNSPLPANTQLRDNNMTLSRTRLDQVLILKDPAWPIINQFSYKFRALDQDTIDDLKSFLDASYGKSIKLTDHESVERTGLIITPENEIVEVNRNCYKYDVAFTFQQDAENLFALMTEDYAEDFVIEDASEQIVEESVQ